jgi:exodeoxyribonuclease V gamma subunit
MYLYRSNRSERLVDKLAEVVRRPLPDALTPECIVVQSQGMERWLAMALSGRLGVWANANFPFPRHQIESAFDAVLGDTTAQRSAYSQRAMMWSIAALLPERLNEPGFEPIAHYLHDDTLGALRIALAQRIARVFDDYTVYRPELLRDWQRGEEQGWEAKLWRALCERNGDTHQAARAERFIAALAEGAFEHAELPKRVCLFGISSLPPLYVSMLAALSQHVEMHLFVLSPSREYFADLHARKHLSMAATEESSTTEGHPLLASLGRLGREFQELLEERTQYIESDNSLYDDPGTGCLLHALQSDILNLRNRGAVGGDVPRLPLSADDHSIDVHICHSPTREVEVLHDQLVALLQDESLQPHEIVVMAPDIELYAPIIEAVFGQIGRPKIPYALADRTTRTSHEVVDALHALMQTFVGRMPASAVLDLLSLDCIRRRFEIETDEVETLRTWVQESGVRFCVDEQHRAEVGQPALRENTWRFGLDRLLLGYAMQGRNRTLFAGVLAYDEIEGSTAELLGKFSALCERLFHHRAALADPRPLPEWRDGIAALLHDMLDPGLENADQLQVVHGALLLLCNSAEAAGYTDPMDRQSLLTQLSTAFDESAPARGLLARGVTFCQLVPMRSIPFQVVCLIGMNDDAFPGRSTVLGFDRMAEDRKLGDRSRRDDDRYMFLEALLSARRRFMLSYVGRGVHDNRALPPSVVVGELLDCIAQGFSVPVNAELTSEPRALLSRLCVEHRLHAFSPRYFSNSSDPRLFSYASAYCDGARAIGEPRHDPLFLSGNLLPGPPLLDVTLDELIAWVSAPIRSFVQRSLGIYLGDELEPLLDREPVTLDALQRWKLGAQWLQLLLTGVPSEDIETAARATGALPLGTVGELACKGLLPEVQALAAAADTHRSGKRLDALPIALDVEGVRLTGSLHGLWADGQLVASYSRVGGRFELEHFIRHLALNCALQREPRAGYSRRSLLVARSADGEGVAQVDFAPVADAETLLGALIVLMRESRHAALPFVFDPSFAYASARLQQDGDQASALAEAQKVFDKQARLGPDEYVALCFPNVEDLLHAEGPLGFGALAETVFAALLACRSVT